MEQGSEVEINEEPILLLLLTKGGVLLFTYPFTKEPEIDDDLISGYLAAFNSFITEIFSQGLDRMKFGDYTLLIDTITDFSLCYVFKGNIIPANEKLQKLRAFMENSEAFWQHLGEILKANRVIEIKNVPFLDDAITEIFEKKGSRWLVKKIPDKNN
ncbi:MAG: hypothetical protein ACFFE4_22100 [Candidatus Thorarchaeota archaeon]